MTRRGFLAAAITTLLSGNAWANRTAISADYGERDADGNWIAGNRGNSAVATDETTENIAVVPENEVTATASQPELTPSGPLIIRPDQANLTLSGLHFKDILDDGVYAIYIKGHSLTDPLNITIKNCLFENVRWAIRVDNAVAVTINGNRFDRVGQGIRVTAGRKIRIDYNEFVGVGELPVMGRGYGNWWAQNAIQTMNLTGTGNSVSYNLFDNSEAHTPYLEDVISLWNSGGTQGGWMQVVGNTLRGSRSGGSGTGCGIIAGDAVGAEELYAGYINISDNTLCRTQAVGIGIAGGNHYRLAGNRIYQPLDHTRLLSQHPYNSEYNSIPGAGITVYDYSRTLECHSMSISGNQVYAIRSDEAVNPYWASAATCSDVVATGNQFYWSVQNSGELGDAMIADNMFAGLDNGYFSARFG